MKADRLVSVLLLLQAQGKASSRMLAERLEVSQRTVHRDMEALSAAGVPVFALRGAQGGWQLEAGWRTTVPALDDAELNAFLMAQPRSAGDPRLAASAERALAKLMAALPPALRERAASIRQRIHVDATGWRGASENLSMLPIVQDAVWRDRVLTIRYRHTGRERVQRTIEPLGLVAKGSTWYVVASTDKGMRTFRVSRIEDAVLTGSTFARPRRFDLAKYWKSSTEEFARRRRYTVTVRATPAAADMLRAWCAVRSSGDARTADGWIVLRVDFEDEAEACFVALGFGTRVEVDEPASLRARIAAEAAAMAART
jgi:predicted DNA-binding transcriptional regulator YafY